MSDIDRYLTDDLVDKVIDAIDGRRHEYRANTDTWVPYCICGWSAEEPYDMAAYDRHLAVEALKAAAPLIAAKALRDAAYYGPMHFAATHRDQWSRGRLLVTHAWLHDRADEIAGEQR